MDGIILRIGDTWIPSFAISSWTIKSQVSFGASLNNVYELYVRTNDGQSHLILIGMKEKDIVEKWIQDNLLSMNKNTKIIDITHTEEELTRLQLEKQLKNMDDGEKDIFAKLDRINVEGKPDIDIVSIHEPVPTNKEEEEAVMEKVQKIKKTRKKKSDE